MEGGSILAFFMLLFYAPMDNRRRCIRSLRHLFFFLFLFFPACKLSCIGSGAEAKIQTNTQKQRDWAS